MEISKDFSILRSTIPVALRPIPYYAKRNGTRVKLKKEEARSKAL